MSLMVDASMWLTGRWLPTGYPMGATVVGEPMVDIFGQAITVGSKVKLIGTVTAVNPLSNHFHDITFVPDYPNNTIVENQVAGNIPLTSPIVSVRCHPLQLVKVGSSL